MTSQQPSPIDPELKAKALEIAEHHGAAEASRRTNIPAGTIRAWRSREGMTGPPAVDTRAVRRIKELLAAGKRGDAQAAALALVLELIGDGGTDTVALRIEAVLEDCGIEVGPAISALIAHHTQSGAAPVAAPPEMAARAQQEMVRSAASRDDYQFATEEYHARIDAQIERMLSAARGSKQGTADVEEWHRRVNETAEAVLTSNRAPAELPEHTGTPPEETPPEPDEPEELEAEVVDEDPEPVDIPEAVNRALFRPQRDWGNNGW